MYVPFIFADFCDFLQKIVFKNYLFLGFLSKIFQNFRAKSNQ